jgi:hypothetical protein
LELANGVPPALVAPLGALMECEVMPICVP